MARGKKPVNNGVFLGEGQGPKKLLVHIVSNGRSILLKSSHSDEISGYHSTKAVHRFSSNEFLLPLELAL